MAARDMLHYKLDWFALFGLLFVPVALCYKERNKTINKTLTNK